MKYLTVILFCSLQITMFSQEREYKGSFILVGVSYLELKDELNHGFVFKGPNVKIEYGFQKIDSTRYFEYSASFNGGGITTKDTWSFMGSLTPVNIHYSYNILKNDKLNLYLGPSFLINYNVQSYPDLHAATSALWLTNYDIGFNISGFLNIKERLVELKLRNTLFAFSSRPETERDPYYFTKKIGKTFSNIHNNMEFGSVNKYFQTEFNAIAYFNSKKRTKSIAYVFQYTNYSNEPAFKQMQHSIKYTWYLKKNKR